jgi:hypothetical protein
MSKVIDGLVFSVEQLRLDADEIAACGGGNEAMCMRWAADEITRLRAALVEERGRALEEAAKVASMWASRTGTEAIALRKLRDYARALQLVSEAEGASRIAAAIRSLMEKPE